MDAFEQIVAEVFKSQNYWVQPSVKVILTNTDREAIARTNFESNPEVNWERHLKNARGLPRPEIDLVAYKPQENKLLVIECKSYIDSKGVQAHAFVNPQHKDAERYKLFTRPGYRQVVFQRLLQQFMQTGLILQGAELQLCLACGKISNENTRNLLRDHFLQNGWQIFDDRFFRVQMTQIANGAYENSILSVLVKILFGPNQNLHRAAALDHLREIFEQEAH
jgi:hypothetical protein